MEPVYVFWSYMRSFSTACMAGAQAGGLTAHYTPGRAERMAKEWDRKDFSLNYGKLYELEICSECSQRKQVLQSTSNYPYILPDCHNLGCATMFNNDPSRYAGMVVKMISVFNLPKHQSSWSYPDYTNFNVVFLQRSWESILQSHERAFYNVPNISPEQYYYRLSRTFEECTADKKRIVWVDNLVHDDFDRRVEEWTLLGWPIDPIKAAMVIDTDRIRFHAANLVPGILDRKVEVRTIC